MNDRRSHQLEWIGVGAVTALAAALRLYQLGQESFWLDEVNGLRLCLENSKAFWTGLGAHHAPPLHFLILRFLSTWTLSEFWLRLPSAIFAVLSIPVAYRFLRNFFPAVSAGAAVLFLALSPAHLTYSQEARPYALYLLLCLLSMDFFHRSVLGKEQSRGRLAIYCLASALALYTHYIAFFVLGTQAVLYFGYKKIRKDEKGLPVRPGLLCAGGIFALYLPWLPFLLQRLFGGYSIEHLQRFALRPGDLATFAWWRRLAEDFSAGHGYSVYLFLAAAVVGIVHLWRQEQRSAPLAVLWFAVPTAAILIFDLFTRAYFAYRVLLFLLPLYLGLVAHGIGALARLIAREKPALRWSLFALGGLVLIRFLGLELIHFYSTTDKPPWREIAACVTTSAQSDQSGENVPGRVFACGDNVSCLEFYLDRDGSTLQFERAGSDRENLALTDRDALVLSGKEIENTPIERWAERELPRWAEFESRRIVPIRVYRRKLPSNRQG